VIIVDGGESWRRNADGEKFRFRLRRCAIFPLASSKESGLAV
jgi:hypothetical protein